MMFQDKIRKAIEVTNLRKSFQFGFWRQRREVLKGISFSVPQGVATGFVGSNGSGKTTTLKLILGFLQPDSGSFRILGSELNKSIKSLIGYLPERPFYYEHLTAFEFLKFHWELGGGGSGFNERCRECLSDVQLSHVVDRRLRSFSKGMLQRIGMAQALLRRPQLLILDEPMSGLDPDGRFLIKSIIQRERDRGTTLFFSSHLLGDMEELCENVVIIDQGRILFDGQVQKLISAGDVLFQIRWTSVVSDSSQVFVEHIKQSSINLRISEIVSQKGKIIFVGPVQMALERAFASLVQVKGDAGASLEKRS